MLYAGVDLHRKYRAVVLDSGGALVGERRLPHDAEVSRTYFGVFGEPARTVV